MKRIVLLMAFLCLAGNAYGGTLVWKTSKAEAVSAAISSGKKILLLAGRETCGNCSHMKNTVCESISPPVQALIQQKFVLWFCDVDASTDWYIYARGLGSFYLPLICCIDPNNPDTYLDRTTGIQSPDEFYARLLAIAGPHAAADFIANPLYGLSPLAVSFTDRSTGSITNWSWDFGDGTSSISKNPSHTYSKPGTYSVSLTVSATGVSDTEVKPAYIRADHAGADVNNDNKVDLYDAILALQLLSNLPEASEITKDKDVNGDDRFGLEEAIHILQNISRLR